MTDRFAGFIVTLHKDIRDDDAEAIIAALRMIKGVASVDPVPASAELHIATLRADQAWRNRIMDLLTDAPSPL